MPKTMIRQFAQTSMLALALFAAPALAQSGSIDTLAGYLRTLSSDPRNLSALLGAGRAALDAGDPNAALGFFSRATQVDARNAKAKAGLASSLVMLERPDEALKLFAEAQQLGIDEDDIAKDRGLAYDLRGDNRLAQRDYALALKNGPDAEVTRRMALSYGIAGDQRSAMALLDPLMRKNDQAAWRARAFVMAMTGNLSDANAVARGVMPGSLAASMQPFLQQLGKLNAAERAHAVNFGSMPAGGRRTQVALGDPYRGVSSPPPVVQVAANDVPTTTTGRRGKAEPTSRAGRRRPGEVQVAANTPVRQPEPEPQYLPPPERKEPVFAPANSVVQDIPEPKRQAPANVAAIVPEAKPAPPRKQALPLAPGGRLSGLLAGLTMEQETAPVGIDSAKLRAQKLAAKKKADAEAKAKAEAAAKAKELAEEKARIKKNPSRVWVQIASGPNESALPFTWNKMRKEHDDLDGKSAWAMPYGRTNRLLVGPMKSQADAKALVTKLGKDGLKTNVFLSEAGQEIEKLGGK
jgi:Flp pilus assembly protein TadD